ncbi:uncharacterized protein LACBIDRAFT_300491 [Laccaria bicolor S238N-H82]|uniref:Predicted protein n=1 Tax=Laccaria bicolor (strain S238N-H82 / ATCC MYA-4686) TaxID=486041 RepID=B0DGW4_LACBS|nr:uncharacterized protein LACBIDRAFT_300491 [Laccaria bicolor S238N-H82]EDR06345.1 predicted protein [Laccaria bicolor S238N-H82]|eukprot:XP_001883206.1 predicted protein [Laccaria bicolor S238N-H82]
MKDTLTDANFPRTADLRVYHLGLRPSEVANRIITVGSPSRAKAIAAFLDDTPQPFVLSSERGFLTITGRYKSVPISIVSIGMGSPNMDFFVREVRECLSGDMAVVRLGSCGALVDAPVGSVVIPRASVSINRNVDFDFTNPGKCDEVAYRISKPVSADPTLHQELSLLRNPPRQSFYSSQGRQTSFQDHNSDLIEQLQTEIEDLATLEMETFHLYHLARCWGGRTTPSTTQSTPLTTGPVRPVLSLPLTPISTVPPVLLASPNSVIRAAAAQMVFASRTSQDFITPEEVSELEHWTGQGVLNALANLDIPPERLHSEHGSVWEVV